MTLLRSFRIAGEQPPWQDQPMVSRAGRRTVLCTATVPLTGPAACRAPRVTRKEPRRREEVTRLCANRLPVAVLPFSAPSSAKVSLLRAMLWVTRLRSPL
nr:hypothetical protein GCM10020093_004840 [Planobispora longispora]